MNNQKERAVGLLALNGFVVAVSQPILKRVLDPTQMPANGAIAPSPLPGATSAVLLVGWIGLLGAYMCLARANSTGERNPLFLGWQLVALTAPVVFFVFYAVIPLLASAIPGMEQMLKPLLPAPI